MTPSKTAAFEDHFTYQNLVTCLLRAMATHKKISIFFMREKKMTNNTTSISSSNYYFGIDAIFLISEKDFAIS